MMPDKIIEPATFSQDGTQVSLSIRMPWYRALPLSSVAGVRWLVDGVPVEGDSITWTLDGSAYALSDLPPLHDKWWFVLDSAHLDGTLSQPVPDSADHLVEITLALYIPYITTAHGVLKLEETDAKRISRSAAA